MRKGGHLVGKKVCMLPLAVTEMLPQFGHCHSLLQHGTTKEKYFRKGEGGGLHAYTGSH